MSKISFKYCPICSEELEMGKAHFPVSRTILFEHGRYYSDEITEELDGQPIKKFFRKSDKSFDSVGSNPSGYCPKCAKIFVEFNIIGEYGLIDDEEDYYNESADSLYDDKIVSYDDDINEKYNTIDGYKILTDSIKFKKPED